MDVANRNANWVTVERFFSTTNAHIAAGRLESEGVPVFLHGINHVSVNWLIANAMGGIRLQVPEKDLARAQRILSEWPGTDAAPEDRCPQCGDANLSRRASSWKLSFLALHLFTLPLPWRSGGRICESCKYEWDDADDRAD